MLQYYTVHMHAIYSQTQNNTYTKMNLSLVKWAQWDKTQSRELLGLFICVRSSLCKIVAHNTAQNRPDNHHCSDDVYLRERGSGSRDDFLSRSSTRACLSCAGKTPHSIDKPRWQFWRLLGPAFAASRVQHLSYLYSKFALRPHHVSKYGTHPTYGRWD